MEETIVYVLFEKYCYNKNYQDLGCAQFKEKGYNVEIWTFVHCVCPHIVAAKDVYEGEEIIYVNNWNEAKENVQRLREKKAIYILYPGNFRQPIGNKLRRYITKNNGVYFDMYMDHVLHKYYWDTSLHKRSKLHLKNIVWDNKNSSKIEKENGYNEIKKKIGKAFDIGFRESFHIIIEKLRTKMVMIFDSYICKNYPPQYNLFPTEAETEFKSSGVKKYIGKDKDIFFHSKDYDMYLLCADKFCDELEILNGKDYIVYIDQGGNTHPDIKNDYFGKEYISELNHMFDLIEQQYKIPVVIAVHPKANYQGREFGDRMAFKSYTDILIKNSKLVLIEMSTSLNWIILWRKPFVIITSDSYRHKDIEAKTINELWSAYFNRPILNMSKLTGNIKIDDYCVTYESRCEAYEEYQELLIKNSGTPQMLSYEIILDLVEKIYLRNDEVE
ncbi:hypothetical protein AALA90_00225 [Lachnospiraceae bacterium 38-10]